MTKYDIRDGQLEYQNRGQEKEKTSKSTRAVAGKQWMHFEKTEKDWNNQKRFKYIQKYMDNE